MNALPNVTSFAAFAKETSAMVSPPPFGAMWFSQAVKDLPPQKWLIDRIMPEDALVILHGPHGVAKTFVSLDMDIRIAIGEDWRGHRVSKGGVVYVAAEGRAGLRKRLKAWSDHYGDPGNIPFVLMTERVNLLDEDEVKHFIETIKRVNARMEMMGTPLRKITFDTLARCMPRGNENSHEHMGALVDNVDRIRRSVGSVTAMFCHHSGKDQTRGPRGHTGVPAAADTMIELSKDGSRLITAKVSKQKDEEDSAKIHFRLKRLVIGKNQWGEDATSCVAIEGESDSYTHRDKPTIRGPAKIAYDILTQCVLDYGKDAPTTSVPRGCKAVGWRQWREACFRLGLTMTEDEHAKNKAFINAARHLKEKQWIGVSDPWVWQAR